MVSGLGSSTSVAGRSTRHFYQEAGSTKCGELWGGNKGMNNGCIEKKGLSSQALIRVQGVGERGSEMGHD